MPTSEPKSGPSPSSTRLILPSWWVDAYEAASVAVTQQQSAMEQSVAAGIAPALTPLELNALAVVVSGLQAQLLAGETTLVVRSEEHLKHANTSGRARRFMFEKVMQLLPGLRVLRAQEGQELRAHRMFEGDVWKAANGGFAIELRPAALGAELLLGYSDAHLDLVRAARCEVEGSALLAGMPPLAIWRSIWLDLQGLEQALFMRMERAMQWEFRWLQLEGVFGMPLAALYAGLEEDGTQDDPRATLERRLKLVARLGRKLCSHGFLSSGDDGQFLAHETSESGGLGLSLVWQVARERLAFDAAFEQRVEVCQYMLRRRSEAEQKALLRVLLPDAAGVDAMQDAKEIWDGIRAVGISPDELAGLCYRPSQTLLPQTLFLELCLRRRHASPYPLPAVMVSGELAELTDPRAERSIGERFARFARAASEAPELLQTLSGVPLASWTSDASKQDLGLQRYLGHLLRDEGLRAEATNVDVSRPLLAVAGAQAPSAAKLSPTVTSQRTPDQTGSPANGPEAAKAPVLAAGLPFGDGRKAGVSGALASRMRKIATEELDRMREGPASRYRDLKTTYLASLDEVGRRLILDVQKRMQATMFEDHLRQRLVRFMVENPGAWRSGDVRKSDAIQ